LIGVDFLIGMGASLADIGGKYE